MPTCDTACWRCCCSLRHFAQKHGKRPVPVRFLQWPIRQPHHYCPPLRSQCQNRPSCKNRRHSPYIFRTRWENKVLPSTGEMYFSTSLSGCASPKWRLCRTGKRETASQKRTHLTAWYCSFRPLSVQSNDFIKPNEQSSSSLEYSAMARDYTFKKIKKAWESVPWLVPISEAFALPILPNEQCRSPRRYVDSHKSAAYNDVYSAERMLKTTYPQRHLLLLGSRQDCGVCEVPESQEQA